MKVLNAEDAETPTSAQEKRLIPEGVPNVKVRNQPLPGLFSTIVSSLSAKLSILHFRFVKEMNPSRHMNLPDGSPSDK